MRPAGIVALQVGVENLQHLLDCLEPGAVALDPEVARPLDAGGAMLDLPVLQEELVGVAARPAAELAPPPANDGRSGASDAWRCAILSRRFRFGCCMGC